MRRLALLLTLPLLASCASTQPLVKSRIPTGHELARLTVATAPYETWIYASERCPLRVAVLPMAAINAAVTVMALEGCPNTVVLKVSEGVLAMPESEFRGIIAHEMGHVVLRHGVTAAQRQATEANARGVSSGVFNTIGAAAGAIPGYGAIIQLGAMLIGSTSDLTIRLVARGYDRDQEREADEWGARFLLRTQGPQECSAMASAFERMAAEGGSGLALFSTHPGASGRAETIRRICQEGSAENAAPPRGDRFIDTRGDRG